MENKSYLQRCMHCTAQNEGFWAGDQPEVDVVWRAGIIGIQGSPANSKDKNINV